MSNFFSEISSDASNHYFLNGSSSYSLPVCPVDLPSNANSLTSQRFIFLFFPIIAIFISLSVCGHHGVRRGLAKFLGDCEQEEVKNEFNKIKGNIKEQLKPFKSIKNNCFFDENISLEARRQVWIEMDLLESKLKEMDDIGSSILYSRHYMRVFLEQNPNGVAITCADFTPEVNQRWEDFISNNPGSWQSLGHDKQDSILLEQKHSKQKHSKQKHSKQMIGSSFN